jgi:hypothetical protein
MSDVGLRHAVTFNALTIQHQHSFVISSSAVSVAREVRFCVIAVVLGFTTVAVIRRVLGTRELRG